MWVFFFLTFANVLAYIKNIAMLLSVWISYTYLQMQFLILIHLNEILPSIQKQSRSWNLDTFRRRSETCQEIAILNPTKL